MKTVNMYGTVITGILPTVVLIISKISLLIRVVKQKYRLRQNVQWRKYRRMIIQVCFCSGLYLFFNLPYWVGVVIRIGGIVNITLDQYQFVASSMSYLICLWMPFVCLAATPHILEKINQWTRVRFLFTAVVLKTILTRPID